MANFEALSERFIRFKQGLGMKYEPFVRDHLAKVYTILGATSLATAGGAMLQVTDVLDMGTLAAIITLVLVLGLHLYQDDGKNYRIRLGMLLSFGFFSGQTLGPLLSYIMIINPAIILSTILCTAITFFSLTFAALLAERGKFLFLGGLLISVLNTMALVSLANMFFQSYFVQMGQLYVGVFVMAAFILFDTQSIIEKCRCGNRDSVQHALDLFFDILSLFRRLLIILTQKEERKRNDRNKKQ